MKEEYIDHYPFNGNNGNTWKGTARFSEVAKYFDKNQVYCPYIDGSFAYKEFWDREEKRIKEGMKLRDGQWIAGLHYLYLNYCLIYDKIKKKFVFPDFWDMDADYFKRLEEAQKTGKHFAILKARQRGFSLKNMVPLLKSFIFDEGSINYLLSFLDTHGSKSMSMLKHYLNHINKHTDFYTNRSPDTSDHIVASFKETIEGRESVSGRLNEVYKLCMKDDPTKGVGGSINLLIYEEAGLAKNLQETLDFASSATEAGDSVTGQMIIYGSVGDLEDCRDLEHIFYHPAESGFYEMDNIWEDDSRDIDPKCGYFVPEFICYQGCIDPDGNSNIREALKRIEAKRAVKRKGSTSSYILYCSQRPVKPSEAFMARGHNKYPVEALKKHLNRLETLDFLRNYGYPVKLHEANGKIKEELLDHHSHEIFDEWPVKNKDKAKTAPIWIYEPPMPEATAGLYIASSDSADIDDAATSDSILTTYIYKKDSGTLDEYARKEIVAFYAGRPENVEEYYENTRLMMMYYSAKDLVENNNPGIINYFRNKNCLRLLEDQMDEIKGLNPTSVVKRSKGFHETSAVMLHGDELIKQYLSEEIGILEKEDGTVERVILGLERIKDRGLIKELIYYNDKDNFDRHTAFRGVMLYEEATFKRKVQIVEDEKSIANQLSELKLFRRRGRSEVTPWGQAIINK